MIYSMCTGACAVEYALPREKTTVKAAAARRGETMTLCEEIYFEINVVGVKSEVKKFASFLRSGELDEFFEMDSSYIDYQDDYADLPDTAVTGFTFSNDDIGIEVDEFDTDEFLDVFCMAGRALDVRGRLFDVDDEEYLFISPAGDSYYLNAKKAGVFNEDIAGTAFSDSIE